jgi:hypothetical protein
MPVKGNFIGIPSPSANGHLPPALGTLPGSVLP